MERNSSVSPLCIDVVEIETTSTDKKKIIVHPTTTKKTVISDSERIALNRIQVYLQDINWLLFSMKLIGLYFENAPESSATNCTVDEEISKKDCEIDKGMPYTKNESTKSHPCKRFAKIYATLILVVLWIQTCRTFSSIKPNEMSIMMLLIVKLLALDFTLLSTLMCTSFYIASHRGSLLKTLQGIPRLAESEIPIRRLVIISTVIAWLVIIINTVYIGFVTLNTPDGAADFLIAPFSTLITHVDSKTMMILKIVYMGATAFGMAHWAFSSVAAVTITFSLTHLFREVNAKVRYALKTDGRFEGNLEAFRQQHQRISRLVDKTDKFLTLYMSTTVGCNIAMFVFVLYFLIFSSYTPPIILVMMSFWMMDTALHLSVTALGSVALNNAAHKLGEKLPSMDLTSLSAESIGQLNVFLKTLGGSSIGFSVLRIFVIDRNTILTIIGLVITYFLLVMQMASQTCVMPSYPAVVVSSNSSSGHPY